MAVSLSALRAVPHFLDDQRGGVLIEDLIDRDHHAHLHEGLDDLIGLDGHALGELTDRDRVADVHLTNDRCGRLLENMLRIEADGHVAAPLLLLLAAAAHAVRHVYRVVTVSRLFDHALFFVFLSRALGLGALLRLFLGLRGLAALLVCALLGCFVGCCRPPLVLFEPLALLCLALCGREPLAFRGLTRLARLPDRRLFGVARVFLCATRRVELFLLLARLLFEDIAFDVGALLTHLHVDRARTALAARELELAIRLAVQCDASRRGVGSVRAPVILLQVRQQLELSVLADDVVGTANLDAGLVELLDEPIDGNLEYFREVRDCNFRHACSSAVLRLRLLLEPMSSCRHDQLRRARCIEPGNLA